MANAASSAGGSSSGSGSGSSSGSGGSGTTPPTGPDGKPVTPGVHFTYTADVLFGPRSAVKTYKSVAELDVLPDGKSPIISFMGVKGGNTAMFFIADPGFQAQGEGTCQPTPENCVFLYLKKDAAHNEETLSAQNGQVEYTLKLTGLHIKSLPARARPLAARRPTSRPRRRRPGSRPRRCATRSSRCPPSRWPGARRFLPITPVPEGPPPGGAFVVVTL